MNSDGYGEQRLEKSVGKDHRIQTLHERVVNIGWNSMWPMAPWQQTTLYAIHVSDVCS